MADKSEILWGFHSVSEALKAGKRRFYQVFISDKKSSKRARAIEQAAKTRNISVTWTDSKTLDKMTAFSRHQGVALKASAFPVEPASKVADLIRKSDHPCFVLVIENLEDPHNLGALIRTALCAGVDFILIPKDRCVPPNPTVSRSSAGAMEHAAVFMITNTASILRELKSSGAWVFGLDATGDKMIYDADLTGHIVLVIGGEHKGIRPLVKKECDFLLSIPNKGKINSLNASVAGGIAMFEALRQRSDLKS